MTLPDTMRALVLSGTGFDHLGVREVPVPRPGPGEVLVRVDAAGICTSLVKLIAQGPDHALMYGRDLERHPTILGDEGAVTVVAAGRDVAKRFPVGSRHVVQPAVDHPPVVDRHLYRQGGEGIDKIALGHTLPGHLAQYVLITEETIAAGCVLPIPDAGLAAAHAAMAEPISCCVSGQHHHLRLRQSAPDRPREAIAGLKSGGVTLVLGLGAMGRMHVDAAMAHRPRAILGIDPIGERRTRTLELFGTRAARAGITLAVAAPESTRSELARMGAALGADDVIVAAGVATVIAEAQMLVARGGCLNLFAGLKHDDRFVPFDVNHIHYRESVVTGNSGGSPWDIARTLDLMAAGELEVGAHITRIGGLDDAPTLIAEVAAQRLDGKAVLYPHLPPAPVRTVERWTAADEARLMAEAA